MRKDACRDKLSLSLSGSIADGQILGSLGRDEHLLAKLQWKKTEYKNSVVLIMLFNEIKGQSLRWKKHKDIANHRQFLLCIIYCLPWQIIKEHKKPMGNLCPQCSASSNSYVFLLFNFCLLSQAWWIFGIRKACLA